MSQSLSKIYAHIVFHVNFSNFIKIPENLQPVLHGYIAKVCKNHDSNSVIVGGTSDHIHILCRMSKNIAPSKLLEEIKSYSSKWIKSQTDEYGMMLSKFSWQKGYGIFSVSESQIENVKKYISGQKEHHAKLTFKEEYLLLLKKHNVEYNEEYLWS